MEDLILDLMKSLKLILLNMKLHIILTPPNLPLPRGGAAGGGVLSMHLHMETVLPVSAGLLSFGSGLSTTLDSVDKTILAILITFCRDKSLYMCLQYTSQNYLKRVVDKIADNDESIFSIYIVLFFARDKCYL